MVDVVSWAENFGLVDEVNVELSKNLCLNEVTDTGLSHDRNLHRSLNALNEVGVTHASYATLRTNVCGDTLQSHYCNCTSVFSNASLLCVDDVHDDTALELLCKSTLDAVATSKRGVVLFSHVLQLLL